MHLLRDRCRIASIVYSVPRFSSPSKISLLFFCRMQLFLKLRRGGGGSHFIRCEGLLNCQPGPLPLPSLLHLASTHVYVFNFPDFPLHTRRLCIFLLFLSPGNLFPLRPVVVCVGWAEYVCLCHRINSRRSRGARKEKKCAEKRKRERSAGGNAIPEPGKISTGSR